MHLKLHRNDVRYMACSSHLISMRRVGLHCYRYVPNLPLMRWLQQHEPDLRTIMSMRYVTGHLDSRCISDSRPLCAVRCSPLNKAFHVHDGATSTPEVARMRTFYFRQDQSGARVSAKSTPAISTVCHTCSVTCPAGAPILHTERGICDQNNSRSLGPPT